MQRSSKSEQTVKKIVEEGMLLKGTKLQHADSFKYLGSTLTKTCDSAQYIRVRTAIALSSMGSLDNIWKNKTSTTKP
ncbi:hypothetical protein DPMN_065733 [Dreissena polymorpha]|uniref:Uncharacterized protein n=1 Tax=Dreissena polymorpha TaxID=45954 RepID=A0A9D3YX11_DREPO|nr:hypothetical protein DPMN_065733 [Dreissena polymorpha]